MHTLDTLNAYDQINGLNDTSIVDFWSWAYSDILSSRSRCIFAKFLVAKILGMTGRPRSENDIYDFKYKDKKINVRSASYYENWHKDRPTSIKYDISKKKAWFPETNRYTEKIDRFCDVYVFSLYKEKKDEITNILDLKRWEFFVIPTNKVDSYFQNTNSVTLKDIQGICYPVPLSEVKQCVDMSL